MRVKDPALLGCRVDVRNGSVEPLLAVQSAVQTYATFLVWQRGKIHAEKLIPFRNPLLAIADFGSANCHCQCLIFKSASYRP